MMCCTRYKYSIKTEIQINESASEVVHYKISMQYTVAFSYINNKLTERGVKKEIPFNIF